LAAIKAISPDLGLSTGKPSTSTDEVPKIYGVEQAAAALPWVEFVSRQKHLKRSSTFVVDNAVHNLGAVILGPRICHGFVTMRKE
jgi:hypothetical protein